MEVKLPSLLGMSDRPTEHRELSLPIINMVDILTERELKTYIKKKKMYRLLVSPNNVQITFK